MHVHCTLKFELGGTCVYPFSMTMTLSKNLKMRGTLHRPVDYAQAMLILFFKSTKHGLVDSACNIFKHEQKLIFFLIYFISCLLLMKDISIKKLTRTDFCCSASYASEKFPFQISRRYRFVYLSTTHNIFNNFKPLFSVPIGMYYKASCIHLYKKVFKRVSMPYFYAD